MNLTSKTFSALISTFASRLQPSQPNEKGGRVAACGALIALASLAFASSAVAGEAPHRPVSLPLTFEENRGQADASWKYVLHRDGLEAVFYRNGFGFILPGSKGNAGNVRVRLVGGDAAPDGKNLLQGRSNYLIGALPTTTTSNTNISTLESPWIFTETGANWNMTFRWRRVQTPPGLHSGSRAQSM